MSEVRPAQPERRSTGMTNSVLDLARTRNARTCARRSSGQRCVQGCTRLKVSARRTRMRRRSEPRRSSAVSRFRTADMLPGVVHGTLLAWLGAPAYEYDLRGPLSGTADTNQRIASILAMNLVDQDRSGHQRRVTPFSTSSRWTLREVRNRKSLGARRRMRIRPYPAGAIRDRPATRAAAKSALQLRAHQVLPHDGEAFRLQQRPADPGRRERRASESGYA